MSESNTYNTGLEGYELIGKVAKETHMPTDEMVQFLMNIIRTDNVDPKTLNLDQLRVVVLNYLEKL